MQYRTGHNSFRKLPGLLLCLFLFAGGIVQAQGLVGDSINVAVRVRKTDEQHHVSYADWKDFPTMIIDNLKGFKSSRSPHFDNYGGDAGKPVGSKGFFRVQLIGDRWWCIDPDGNRCLNIAMNSLNTGPSERNQKAFSEKFGDNAHWIRAAAKMLRENGFNSSGSWSDTKSILLLNQEKGQSLAYAINWSFMSQYGKKRGGTYQVPGHTGYPNNVIFVFDPGFETFCDEWAQQAAAYKDDKNLFGYFSDNEMPFNITNLQGYLTLPDKNDPGYIAAKKWIDDRKITEDKISDQDRRDFLAFEAERYFSLVSKSLRKYDPNHMYIGCRFYSSEKNVPEFMRAAGKYLDIVSVNYYGAWTPSQRAMNNWSDWSGRPFIVTEYYIKAEDSGLPNQSGAGWIVKTQADRGNFYQNFCMGLLQSRNCVGWHWFKYQDNDPTQKDAEPSNTDANKGIVDNEYNPYQPLLDKMKQLNLNRYALVDYFDAHRTVDTSFELYLLIGQSNMAGRGPLTDELRNEGDASLFMLNKDYQWVPAHHPLHFDKPSVAGVGPGLQFGLHMMQTGSGKRIGLIPAAVGGTSINVWVPGAWDEATQTHPYDDAMKRLTIAMRDGVLKGVIWLQGEADSNPERSVNYLARLKELIERVRTVAGNPSLPFVAGELGRYTEQYQNINKQLANLPQQEPHTAIVSSEGFTDKGDHTHFDSASAEEYGKRFAEAMKKLLLPAKK